MKPKIEYRNTLYYGKYEYKVSMVMASNFRRNYCDSYKDYQQYVENSDKHWYYGNSPRRPPLDSDIPGREEVVRYYQWLDSIDKTDTDYGTRQENKRLSLYSNDLLFLSAAADAIIPVKGVTGYYQAKVPTEPETMAFKNPPKFGYRKYFKADHITQDQRDALLNFIAAQQELGTRITLSPGIARKLGKPALGSWGWYVPDSSFIEYDDESMVMALMLMFGDNLKPRTYRLVQRTDTV